MAKSVNKCRLTGAIPLLLVFLIIFFAVGCGGETRYQLTASGEPGQGGTVSIDPVPGPDNKYPEGAQVQLQAKPNEGYQFSHWSAGDLELGTAPSSTVTMSGDLVVTAVFEPDAGIAQPAATPLPTVARQEPTPVTPETATPLPPVTKSAPPTARPPAPTATPIPQAPTPTPEPTEPAAPTCFTLSMPDIPSGAGGIVRSPSPNCPTEQDKYTQGTQVTVTATPSSANWLFQGWTGACSDTGPCVVTMETDQTLGAEFVQQFILSTNASPSAAGSVSGAGTYDSGSQVTARAAPASPHWVFVEWSGDCQGQGSCLVTMDRDLTVTAIFEERIYQVTLTTEGRGSVSLEPPGGSYRPGTVVVLTANPEADWGLDGWTGACSGTDACVVTMDGNRAVTANFVVQFTLTTAALPFAGGTLSLPAVGKQNAGKQVTVTATSAVGYSFSHWSGACLGPGPCIVTMDGDQRVEANFQRQFSLTVNCIGDALGFVDPHGCGLTYFYDAGTPVLLTARPSGDNTFGRWTGDAAQVRESIIVAVNRSTTVTAAFWKPVVQYTAAADLAAASLLAEARGYNLVQATDAGELGDSRTWILIGQRGGNPISNTLLGSSLQVADSGFIRAFRVTTVYDDATRDVIGISGWSPLETLASVKWVAENGIPSKSLKQEWVAIQYCSDDDLPAAQTLSRRYKWPLVNTCNPADLAGHDAWVLVGPSDTNPVFAAVFGNAVTSRDLGFVVIQFDEAYVTGEKSLVVWGVASWRVLDTEASTSWIADSGLPVQPQRFLY